jgi:hypothetical protein
MVMKRILQLTVAIVLLGSGIAGATCDSAYVRQKGRVITVLPTNIDDTANLQCAFNLGSQIPGVVLQLSKGTYITGRIKVDGFVGSVRGAGMKSTIIRNPDIPIYTTPDDFYQVDPNSDAFAPPYLIVFLGGDYSVTDLTVSITGGEPATDWSIFGIREWLGNGIKSLAGPFVILGSPTGRGYRKANAAFYRVKLTGELSADPLYGYNVYNGIFIQGFVGPALQPLRGSFSINESVFDTVASPVPTFNLRNSRVNISGNVLNNVAAGGEVIDLKDTLYAYAHNQATGSTGVLMYDNCLGSESNCGMHGSELIVRNNQFQSTDGVLIDASFSGTTSAHVLGNDFTGVSGLGVRLGPATSHCLVVLTAPTTVEDLGTDNVVIGPKQAGGKQRATIRPLLRMHRRP